MAIISPAATPSTTSAVPQAASRMQVAGIVVLAAGIGWLNGNFIQPVDTPWGAIIDLLHLAPLLVLVPLAMTLFTRGVSRGARNGVTGVAAFMLFTCAVFIALGVANPDPNSIGVHDITDWSVVACIATGAALWLASLLPAFARPR